MLVIGAGMTGIAAGVKLAEAGYNYTIIEKNPEVGGTWWENLYPGVGVDTPSHFYSYSFELNPDWSHYHPKGAEIETYLKLAPQAPDAEQLRQAARRLRGLEAAPATPASNTKPNP